MITIKKGDKPDYLNSDRVNLAYEKILDFYSSKDRNQKRYDFPFNKSLDKDLKPILFDRFYGKCGYCETKILDAGNGVIDRFRPHNGVRNEKEYFQDLYWWLVYEWDNLVFSCKECSQYKANYFPVEGKRVMARLESLTDENGMLLNPCIDDINNHINHTTDGHIIGYTERGIQTIDLLRLNRPVLVEKRISEINLLILIITSGLEKLEIGDDDLKYLKSIYRKEEHIEFLASKYSLLSDKLAKEPLLPSLLRLDNNLSQSIQRQIDFEKSNLIEGLDYNQVKNQILKNDYFPIEYIEIKNFKGISDLRIDFPQDNLNESSWVFLLGENGVGKSSILQAIAIGIKSTVEKHEFEAVAKLIQKGKQKSEITIKERDSDNIIKTVLIRKNNSVIQTGNFGSFLIGYGSLRLSSEDMNSKAEKNLDSVSYENLFNPIKPLNDITNWLKRIFNRDKKLFDSIAYSLKQLLPHDFINNEITIKNNDIIFKSSEKEFAELSDGFKSTITLAVDIMMKLSSGQADMDKMSGIVIIDELGNQLHPRWQMRIVSQLRKVFPRINFIVSTHHPLCLRGSKLGEVILLKSLNDKIEAITELPDPSSLRVDQLLASEFFGLNSLIDPDLEAHFNRYYELLSLEQEINLSQSQELSKLKDELREKKHLGSSLREELMYSVIDNLLAKKVISSKDIPNRLGLKQEAIDRVKQIWSDLNIEINDQG